MRGISVLIGSALAVFFLCFGPTHSRQLRCFPALALGATDAEDSQAAVFCLFPRGYQLDSDGLIEQPEPKMLPSGGSLFKRYQRPSMKTSGDKVNIAFPSGSRLLPRLYRK